jgi:predicted nuclease with TOPRIM domain
MTGAIVIIALGLATLAFVSVPLLRKDAAEAERLASAASEASELNSQQEMLLASLKDLEDDHSTDKLDQADYEELKGRLSAQAVDVMKRMDDLEELRKNPPKGGQLHSVPSPRGESEDRDS